MTSHPAPRDSRMGEKNPDERSPQTVYVQQNVLTGVVCGSILTVIHLRGTLFSPPTTRLPRDEEDVVRRLILASLAVSAAAMSLVVPVASATVPDTLPRGRLCGYRATSDPAPDAPANAMTGTIDAGPAVWDRAFTITCSIQVDDSVHNGTTNDKARESQASVGSGTTHVAVMEPRTVNYLSPEDSQDYLCVSVTWSGGTIYFSAGNDGPDQIPGTADDVPSSWSNSSSVTCGAATQFSTGPFIDAVNDIVIAVVDPIVCAVLQQVHTLLFHGQTPGLVYVDHDGDVFITADGSAVSEGNWRETMFWDCPGYADYDTDPYSPGDDGTPVVDP